MCSTTCKVYLNSGRIQWKQKWGNQHFVLRAQELYEARHNDASSCVDLSSVDLTFGATSGVVLRSQFWLYKASKPEGQILGMVDYCVQAYHMNAYALDQ